MANRKEYLKQWYQNNPEKRKQYYQNTRQKSLKRSKEYRLNNPNKVKEFKLKYNYNLSYRDWLELWENQEGKCVICGNSFISPSDGMVDHNHITGKIRGLLCRRCNFGLGIFKDNLEIMAKAIKYLKNRG